MSAEYDVWFTDDADEFLDRVGEHLAEQPVTGTVVTTTADRIREVGRGDLRHCWFAVVTDAAAEVIGIAMRTAPFAPYPVYVLGMPDAAAAALARALLARGEDVGGVGGMRPAADVFAETIAAATGRRVVVGMHHQLLELGPLVDPRPVAGRLRPVREDEAELALGWVQQFFVDADEQAGRADAAGGHGDEAASLGIDELRRRLAAGVLWFWVDDDDQPVCIAGANPPAFGVARIGPVYTPRPARGRGWAGAAVAEVSRLLRSAGARVILFADHANPTSTSLYRGLGFEVVADTVRIDLT